MESKPMTELPEDASETAMGLDNDMNGMITALPPEQLRAFLNALDWTSQVIDQRNCVEVEDVTAVVDAELAARKAASGGRDGT
jgi:hypothetical protein